MEPAQLSGGWQTVPTERSVIVLAHTVASVMRMLDYVPLLEPDLRIRLDWTAVPDRFEGGVAALLDRLNVPVVPWQEARERSYDLAVSTSLHQMEFLHAKRKFAAPHGCGYGKRFASWLWPASETPPIYGLDSMSLLDQDGQLVFDSVVLSHADQLATLRDQCPEAVKAAVVGGDPAFDRLLASLQFRERYRHDLNVRRGQTLVAVASTWGRESLLAHFPSLPTWLMRHLPADHRVVMTIHPAVWHEHGPRQMYAYLREAHEAGLDLIGPGADWRPLLAAADMIISDHTSLSSYAAAIGIPVLLSHVAKDDIAPGSVIAALAEHSPQLDQQAPLQDQLNAARQASALQQAIAFNRVSSTRGRSAQVLRQTLYSLMALPEPSTPPRI
ncbi:MAG: hypothetical protein ABW215_24180, partial [Kibdelosporangium sp.]